MKIITADNHYEGFIIYATGKYVGRDIPVVSHSSNQALFGAYLEATDDGKFFAKLSCHSAVLYLLKKFMQPIYDNGTDLPWLLWASKKLQRSLHPYLIHLAAGKVDKAVTEALSSELRFMEKSLPSPAGFLNEKMGAADLVIFGSFLPVLEKSGLKFIEKSHPALLEYLKFIDSQEVIQISKEEYFGATGVQLEKWAGKLPCIPSSPACSLDLLHTRQEQEVSDVNKDFCQPGHVQYQEVLKETVELNEGKEAKQKWKTKVDLKSKIRPKSAPILPVKSAKNILVSSALPYVNNVPHLGNIIGSVLSADCFARFCRLRGDNVLYVCGTDEYGTATETKAIAEGLTPQEICDKYNQIHTDIYKWFSISFDHFGRTTTHYQTEIAQSMFLDLDKNGKVTRNSVDQLYCTKCEMFLADRFVEGVCPNPSCKYEDARGDQCDVCGKLVNAVELGNPRCKMCLSPPVIKTSNHLFLDLPKIEKDLRDWLHTTSSKWTPNAHGICESWLRDGLKERCITRDLKWGTPVPLDGYKDKVFYVWYDAPIGYISITMEYAPSDWSKWWMNPDEVSYYQFMAKDNVPFHGIIFPSTQLGTGKNWTKVTHLIATEYLNYEEGKFSKSRGVGIFGDQAKDTGIDSDVWRFYLLYVRPETQDTSFSWADLQVKNNSELLNNLGNFVNRTLKFTSQFYKRIVPSSSPNDSDYTVIALVNHEYQRYLDALSVCKMRDALRYVLAITRIGNQYIQENEPYKLIKQDSAHGKIRGATVIHVSVNIVALVSLLIEPFMPQTSQLIQSYLNTSDLVLFPPFFCCLIPEGHIINEPAPLIRKIMDSEVDKHRVAFAGQAPDLKKSPKVAERTVSETAVQDGPAPDAAEVERLQNLVTEQGIKVRELKAQKATKKVIAMEVEILLNLKRELAKVQGLDPAVLPAPGKKKKK